MIIEGATQKIAGFDGCVIGSTDYGQLVYSKRKMLDWLNVCKGVDKRAAFAWLSYHVWTVDAGLYTPIFVSDFQKDIEEIIEMSDADDERDLDEPEDWNLNI